MLSYESMELRLRRKRAFATVTPLRPLSLSPLSFKDRWIVIVMIFSVLLFMVVFARFVLLRASETLSPSKEPWPQGGP